MVAAKKAQPVESTEPDTAETSKTATLMSPWGSKVTVAAEAADLYKGAGFTSTK